MNKTNISKVINYLIEYSPQLAFKGDWNKVHEWINDGCDLEKDIMPAVMELTKRTKTISTLAYFGPQVLRNRDNRLDTEKALESKPKLADADVIAAQKEWKRKMGIFV